MIKSGRPPKGQESASRDRILDNALQLFIEYGYGNLSLETIAKEARVSLRTIYSHFGGKAGLFGALIRRCSDHFADSLPQNTDTASALTAFAQEYLYQLTRPEAVRIRAILVGEAMRFPDLAAQFYAQGPQRTQAKLAEFFSLQQQQGEFTGLDPHRLANHLVSSLRNENFAKLQLGLIATPDREAIALWAQQTIDLFLHGCLTGRAQ